MTGPAAPPYVPGHGLLADRSLVVTAAAGTGIGSAVARKAIEEGARVLISDFHERRLAETADRLGEETGTRPDAQVCDVTDEAQVQALVDAAADRLGGIDVMINNAGLGGSAKVVDMTDEQWSRVLDVTLTGTFRATRAVLRHMIPRGRGVVLRGTRVHERRSRARLNEAPPRVCTRVHRTARAIGRAEVRVARTFAAAVGDFAARHIDFLAVARHEQEPNRGDHHGKGRRENEGTHRQGGVQASFDLYKVGVGLRRRRFCLLTLRHKDTPWLQNT